MTKVIPRGTTILIKINNQQSQFQCTKVKEPQ